MSISQMLRRIAVLEQTVAALREENRRLREQLDQIQRTNARQAAPFRGRESKKVPEDEKKRPGRKPRHPGTYRAVPEHVDQEIEKPLDCCPNCGGPLGECQPDRLPLRPGGRTGEQSGRTFLATGSARSEDFLREQNRSRPSDATNSRQSCGHLHPTRSRPNRLPCRSPPPPRLCRVYWLNRYRLFQPSLLTLLAAERFTSCVGRNRHKK